MQPIYIKPTPLSRATAPVDTELTCFLVRRILSRDECAQLVAAVTPRFVATSSDYPASYRDNDRALLDDPALANRIYERIRACLPDRMTDETGGTWRLVGLNARFRFCRYRDGQRFCIHRDGAHASGEAQRSRLTVMFYLNDATEFAGGSTRFYSSRAADSRLLGTVRPEAGTAVIFDHELWHDGEAVTSGTKIVMRSDVIYARESPGRADSDSVISGHTGYVWSVIARRDGTLATASRDRTIRVWGRRDGAWVERERLVGHEASVTSLLEPGDDDALWSASRDRTVRRWRSGKSEIVGRHEGAVLCLAALPGGYVASAGADGVIHIWSREGTPVARLQGHDGWVWALACLQDGLLASASEDGTIRLWRLADGSAIGTAVIRASPPRALAAMGRELVCGHADGTLTMWKTTVGRTARLELVNEARVHEGAVCSIADLGNGRIASGGEDNSVRITDVATMTLSSVHCHGAFVRSLCVLPGGVLASAGYDSQVRLWPASS